MVSETISTVPARFTVLSATCSMFAATPAMAAAVWLVAAAWVSKPVKSRSARIRASASGALAAVGETRKAGTRSSAVLG
ncbi:hypothetical protein D3C72_784420 [compost metagenome]